MGSKNHETVDLDALRAQLVPVATDDTITEAGKKILLADFIKVLANEAGSRTGKDIEHVHDMRVATRRLRSAFRLLEEYYKAKPVRPFVETLRRLARTLGAVRDLDVMIADLEAAQAAMQPLPALPPVTPIIQDVPLDEPVALTEQEEQDIIALSNDEAPLQEVIDRLDKKRKRARKKLVTFLDDDHYRDFVEAFTIFLTTPGKDTRSKNSNGIVPHQVRHLLPTMVHDHLAAVRAYDEVIETADYPTLHALRVEFKRLRYVISFFQDVLGASGDDFITDLKAIQDHLGRLNDYVVAREHLEALIEDEDLDASVLEDYLTELQTKADQLRAEFPAVWNRFNTRTVQTKLANALLVLR